VDVTDYLTNTHARTITLRSGLTATWLRLGVWERTKHARNRVPRADGLISTSDLLARSDLPTFEREHLMRILDALEPGSKPLLAQG
jgi:hypothetical protein